MTGQAPVMLSFTPSHPHKLSQREWHWIDPHHSGDAEDELFGIAS